MSTHFTSQIASVSRTGVEAHNEILSERGFSESRAIYYDNLVREGNILLVVYNVTDPSPAIDVFDEYKAQYNPNGSRNLRGDRLPA